MPLPKTLGSSEHKDLDLKLAALQVDAAQPVEGGEHAHVLGAGLAQQPRDAVHGRDRLKRNGGRKRFAPVRAAGICRWMP